jgi:hypothetical protein
MPTAIAAFAGWNDAGSAATDALRFIAEALEAKTVASISAEDYCDFQVNRPIIRAGDDGRRVLLWPNTDIMKAALPSGEELIVVMGVEPSFHWQGFTAELLRELRRLGVDTLWLLGALLADTPHSRPFTVQAGSSDEAWGREFGAEPPSYEGPAGIVTVLGLEASESYGMRSGSLWVPVPHYVGNPPSPKAELALVTKAQDVLGLDALDKSELADEARAWTESVDTLAAADPEIAGYVASLEEAVDTLASPSSSGEALAKEFERYLRRRGS